MIARNHTGHRVGERHQNALLTDKQVRSIRELRNDNPRYWSYARLAAEFGCSQSTARDVVKYWTRASA